MQITKIVTGLLFATLTIAHTDFIEDGQRAELFEIMDHEVPDFRITVPNDEFAELKKQINQGGGFFKRQWGGGGNPWGGNGGGNPWGGGGNPWGGNGGGNPWGGNGGGGGFGQKENYKIKDATMVVDINGTHQSFDKVTFSIGGSSSRMYARQAFNLKIRGKNSLYGRKQFRIRSDAREATYLRSKLACDMHNRLGIPSISANYISLYVNDEYWGFYVLMDSPKTSWAELQYGDKDSTHVYKCKAGGIDLSSRSSNCENENDEVQDHSDWQNFLSSMDRANSIRDAESFFDVDQFLYEMAYEYLTGSWDHFLNTGHNFALYKMPQNHGGKWTMIHYDFDADFGQDVCAIQFMGNKNTNVDYPSWSFDEWSQRKPHVYEILITKDKSRLNKVMKRFVEEVFNPDVLFPRIDELKEFIRLYVKKDKTPVNGKKPGMLNERMNNDYSLEQWEANSEFTNIGPSSSSSGYGLKFWILNRYRKVCKDFKLDCNPEYLDLNYYYDIDRKVEGPINTQFSMGGFPWGGNNNQPQTPKTTQSQPPKPKTTRTTTKRTTTTTRKPVPTSSNDCLAADLGYPCCSPNNTDVVYQDENGDWGVENEEWCGITKKPVESCWSEKLGYPCCSSCLEVMFEDDDGKWGVENDDWCGLSTSC